MRRILFNARISLLAAVAGLLCSTSLSGAQIAQFFQQTGAQNFAFVNNANGTGAFTADADVWFLFQNVTTTPSTTGIQNASLLITATTTSPATQNGNDITQGGLNGTLTITRNSDLVVLLTATFTGARLQGQYNAESAAVLASFSAGDSVIFSSSVVGLDQIALNPAFSLSLSSLIPRLEIGAFGLARSFTAAGSGTFSAAPLQNDDTPVPEPATMWIAGASFVAVGVIRRRR